MSGEEAPTRVRRNTINVDEVQSLNSLLDKTCKLCPDGTPAFTKLLIDNAAKLVNATPDTLVQIAKQFHEAYPDAYGCSIGYAYMLLRSKDPKVRETGLQVTNEALNHEVGKKDHRSLLLKAQFLLSLEKKEEALEAGLEALKLAKANGTHPLDAYAFVTRIKAANGATQEECNAFYAETKALAEAYNASNDQINGVGQKLSKMNPLMISDAQSELDALQEKFPQLEVLSEMAQTLYSRLGKYDRAEQAARKLVQARPGSANTLGSLAAILLESGNEEEAEKIARQALAIHPQCPEAHGVLAQIQMGKGKVPEALSRILHIGLFDTWKTQMLLGSVVSELDADLGRQWFKACFSSFARFSETEATRKFFTRESYFKDWSDGEEKDVSPGGDAAPVKVKLIRSEPVAAHISGLLSDQDCVAIKSRADDKDSSTTAVVALRLGSRSRRRTTMAAGAAPNAGSAPHLALNRLQRAAATLTGVSMDDITNGEQLDVTVHDVNSPEPVNWIHNELQLMGYMRYATLYTFLDGVDGTKVEFFDGKVIEPKKGDGVLVYNYGAKGSIASNALLKINPGSGSLAMGCQQINLNRRVESESE